VKCATTAKRELPEQLQWLSEVLWADESGGPSRLSEFFLLRSACFIVSGPMKYGSRTSLPNL
jgi:hypothetical protein